MEREPTIKERIELFIQRLLDNGFVEQDEDEVQQYIMFFIGTPLDTRIFKKDIITICISESSQEAEIYMNGQQFYGDVQNLDEPVSSTLLKKYLDKMSDSDPIKKMFKQHKNINAYTKWFNTIPLLGTTALGANAYFNNNKDE